MSEIIVIGGAGYIGSVLVPKLLAAGHSVLVVDKRKDAGLSLPDMSGDLWVQDRNADYRGRIVDYDVDVVIDLAGVVGDPACAADPLGAIRENVMGLDRMLGYYAPEHLIYVSTCSVYGQGKSMLYEDSDLNPVSLYGWTKVAAERLVAQSGIPATVLRLGTVHGVSPRQRWDLVVNLLTRQAAETGAITVLNGGQWRPFIHVEDVADAIVAAVEQRVLGTFNVSAENLTLGEMARRVAAILPGTRVSYAENTDTRDYMVSSAAFRGAARWAPVRSVFDTVRELSGVRV